MAHRNIKRNRMRAVYYTACYKRLVFQANISLSVGVIKGEKKGAGK